MTSQVSKGKRTGDAVIYQIFPPLLNYKKWEYLLRKGSIKMGLFASAVEKEGLALSLLKRPLCQSVLEILDKEISIL